MIHRLLNVQTKSLGLATGILGIFSLLNSILALFRDRLLASKFGAGADLDIYFAAFRIPDFVYGVLIAGGIISVFLPVLSEYFNKGEKEGWQFANLVLSSFTFLLAIICLLLFIFAPLVLKIIVPGFSGEKMYKVVGLTRIMLLSPIFFVLSSILSGLLHYFHRFLAYSLAPILYNLGIIFGILFLTNFFGLYGLALGVVLGSFMHFLIQLISLVLAGFKFSPIINFKEPGLRKIFLLTLPRSIGSMVSNFNLFFITALASTFTTGSLSVLTLANDVQTFPINFIGVSFATASFPILARKWAEGKNGQFTEKLNFTIRHIIFLITPLAFMTFILRAQIVRVILGAGQFGWRDTQLTAACLGISSVSIFALSIIPLLYRSFYSVLDTKTPVIIAFFSVLFNVLIAFLLTHLLGFSNIFKDTLANILKIQNLDNIEVVGLSLALAISSLIQLSLLAFFFRKKIDNFEVGKIFSSLWKILIASIAMSVIVYFSLYFAANFLSTKYFFGIFSQMVFSVIVGILAYLASAYFLKSSELKTIYESFFKRALRKPYDNGSASN